jgi:hypothetical protein
MFDSKILAACLIAAALAGCADHKGPPPPTFSPNGEPLLPPQWPAKCEDALDLWFDRLDPGHTGRMSHAVLEADAQRQYQQMDMRHNGKVTAEELSRYRLAQMHGHYLSVSTPGQEGLHQRSDDEDRPGDRLDDAMNDDDRPHHKRKDDDDRPRDAYAALVTDQPDPVMTADTDLDGSVTWEEFRTLVSQNFADYDKAHLGYITKDELHSVCEH